MAVTVLDRLRDWWRPAAPTAANTIERSLLSMSDGYAHHLGQVARAYWSGLDAADQTFVVPGGRQYYGIPTELPNKAERIEPGFVGIAQGALRTNGVVFALEAARLGLFTEARFQFRDRRGPNGRPGDLFGTQALGPLERPWPGGSTSKLLARMLLDADLAGNAFIARREDPVAGQVRLRRMRPDWVTIVIGSDTEPDLTATDLDAEVIAYVYWPGGFASGREPVVLLPDEVCHFTWFPDPEATYKGMSWLSPALRDVEADNAATTHKLAFFRNGATLKTMVSFPAEVPEESVRRFLEIFRAEHVGAENAYKTLMMGGGADPKVIGADLRQLDFKITQGGGETRLAADARVPPVLAGLSEGLQAATYSNYGQAKRHYADGTMRPLWREACASLAVITDVPARSELWYDDRDIAFLRDDAKDQAEILQTQASTINTLITAGYRKDSVVKAVMAGDFSLLQDSGLFSVQLQPPGTAMPDTPALPVADQPKAIAARAATLDDDADDDFDPTTDPDDGPPDDDTLALVVALSELEVELSDDVSRAWDPAQHPRIPKGQPGGGRFMSMVEILKRAIEEDLHDMQRFLGNETPNKPGPLLRQFNRRQLFRAARQRNLKLKRGMDRDEIAQLLIDDLQVNVRNGRIPGGWQRIGPSLPRGIKAAPIGRNETKLRQRLRNVPPGEKPPTQVQRVPKRVGTEQQLAAQLGQRLLGTEQQLAAQAKAAKAAGPVHALRDRLHEWAADRIARLDVADKPRNAAGKRAVRMAQEVLDGGDGRLAVAMLRQAAELEPDRRESMALDNLAEALEHRLGQRVIAAPPVAEKPIRGRIAKADRLDLDKVGEDANLRLPLQAQAFDAWRKAEGALAAGNPPAKVAAEMRRDAALLPARAAFDNERKQLRKWADAIEAARRAPAVSKHIPGKPVSDTNDWHTSLDRHGIGPLADLVENQRGKEKPLAGGAVGDTRLVVYPDGRKVVKKIAVQQFGNNSPEKQASAEQLAPLVLRAMGIKAPRVYRNDREWIHMEFVDGAREPKVIQGWDNPGKGDADRVLQESMEGRVMALADELILNGDRHLKNWFIVDGHIVPIDNGLAFDEGYFRELRAGWQVPRGYFTKAELTDIETRLQTLRPDFEKVGRLDWFNAMMTRLDFQRSRAAAGTPHRDPGLVILQAVEG